MLFSKIAPVQDLRWTSRASSRWETTGLDPQFRVEMGKAMLLAPGRYWVRSVGGAQLDQLLNPTLYLDTGLGYSEAEAQRICFHADGQGEFCAVMHLDKPLHHLRFDPSDSPSPQGFALRGLAFELLAPARASNPTSRLKILINLVRLLPAHGGAGGAGRFCLALLEYLPEEMEVRCAIPPHHIALITQFPLVDFHVCHADDNLHLGEHLRWCDCYLDPLNALRPTSIDANVATIGVVLDLQHMRMPWLFSAAELEARRREYAYAIGRSNHLIAISDYERENLKHFYGREDVTVVHLSGFMAEAAAMQPQGGAAREARPRCHDEPYLVYPAVPWPHKNHEGLVQALGILKRRGLAVRTVLTNTSGNSEGGKRLGRLINMLKLEEIVDRKAFLTEDELHSLFEHAAGMVFPSLYEGFGIPLVDAMKMNVPVLAARTAAAAEIGQEACAYFSNIENVLTVADDIAAFWNDAPRREALKQRGKERGQDFSSRAMVTAIGTALRAAIAAKDSDKGLPPAAVEVVGPEFSDLAIFLLLDSSSPEALAELRAQDDVFAFLTRRLGTKDIVIGLDLDLLCDKVLVDKLRKVPRLITFDGSLLSARDFSIQEFDTRYNRGRYAMVLSPGELVRNDAAAFRRLRDNLNIYDQSHAGRFQSGLKDCVVAGPSSDIEQILTFESMRRQQAGIVDIMLKRQAMAGLKNGTLAHLSHFVTACRVVHVPN